MLRLIPWFIKFQEYAWSLIIYCPQWNHPIEPVLDMIDPTLGET